MQRKGMWWQEVDDEVAWCGSTGGLETIFFASLGFSVLNLGSG